MVGKFLMNLLSFIYLDCFLHTPSEDRNDGCYQIMGLQSSRYKEQMYNYWIIIWEDGKRFPPPRIIRLKGKIRWDDDRTQYFSFPNIEQFVQLIPLALLKLFSLLILQSDKDVNSNHAGMSTCYHVTMLPCPPPSLWPDILGIQHFLSHSVCW